VEVVQPAEEQEKMTFKNELKEFGKSFKNIKVNILFVLFFDLLFIASLVFLPLAFNKVIMGHPMAKESDILEKGISSLTAEELMRLEPIMKSFLIYSFLSFFVFIVLLFLIYTITQCLVWCIIENKKFTLSYFKKSIILSLVWAPLIAIITAVALLLLSLIMYFIKSVGILVLTYLMSFIVLFIVVMIVNLYILVYYYFSKINKTFLSIGKAFTVLFTRFRKIAFHLLLMSLVLLLILLPFGIIAATNPFAKYTIVQGLVSLVYFEWVRFYTVQLAKKEV